MKKFGLWLLEGVGRFLSDDIEQKLHGIAAQIKNAPQNQQPTQISQLMSSRTNAQTGRKQRFIRKFVLINEPNKKALVWDSEPESTVYVNTAHLADLPEDHIYNALVHELIHSTDPKNGELQGVGANPRLDNDEDWRNYMGSRHEFDAFLGMITNWIVRKTQNPQEAQTILRNLSRGQTEALPSNLQKIATRMLKLPPEQKQKFLSRVYQAVQARLSGTNPRHNVPANRNVHQQPGYTGTDENPQQYTPPTYGGNQ